MHDTTVSGMLFARVSVGDQIMAIGSAAGAASSSRADIP
jgi:hypothetical protein